jgi:hypothetical protein
MGTNLVVKVVVPLSKAEEGRDPMVSRRVPVVEGLITQVMAQTVDGEGALLNTDDTEDSGVNETTPPITPAQSCDHRRQYPCACYSDLGVVLVLPDNEGVVAQVGDIGSAVLLIILSKQQPSHVCVPHYNIECQ